MEKVKNLLSEISGEKPNEKGLRKKALQRIAPDYAMLFFDHLHSEYLALKPFITAPATIELLDSLHEKRLRCELTWSDIYSFDLSLVQARPLENLIRKAYDARAKYRSIAGQKEYDEYVASKPPNLPEIHIDPSADPPQPEVIIERALRADLEYLLSKVYLYYAILPVRERLRDWLTKWAVVITLIAVFVIGMTIFINVRLNLFGSTAVGLENFNEISVVFVTVLTVVLAGIIGGCVSMLQRIQSAPSEGDALFNLAALTNGWKGIFLSPLYGGIFAALLFVLFAAGLLEGSAFPKISTPRRQWGTQASATPTPSSLSSRRSSSSPAPSLSPSPAIARDASPQPSASATPDESSAAQGSTRATPADPSVDQPTGETPPSVLATPTPSATPNVASVLQRFPVMQIKDFLKHTGPADGTSYALLIIWSFIAGFAERLVPDTLNRLVTKNEAIQGTNT